MDQLQFPPPNSMVLMRGVKSEIPALLFLAGDPVAVTRHESASY